MALYNPVEWWYVAYRICRRPGGLSAKRDSTRHSTTRTTGSISPRRALSRNCSRLRARCRGHTAWASGTTRRTRRPLIPAQPGGTTRATTSAATRLICKENDDAEDSQGLGVFGRYGWAESRVNDVTNFWSVGLSYQGLFEGRDEDHAGLWDTPGVSSAMWPDPDTPRTTRPSMNCITAPLSASISC